jgi:hypothetical protein
MLVKPGACLVRCDRYACTAANRFKNYCRPSLSCRWQQWRRFCTGTRLPSGGQHPKDGRANVVDQAGGQKAPPCSAIPVLRRTGL